MSIPGSAAPFLLAQQPQQYQIEKSLRFNSADSAFLSRTPSVAGNRKTWTWAGWVKRSSLSGIQALFTSTRSAPTNDQSVIYFWGDNLWLGNIDSSAVTSNLVTTALYRDLSAWMHVIVSCDTTNVVATDRLRLYVNGSRVTSFSTATYPALSYETHFNRTFVHGVGYNVDFSVYPFSGYLADIHFIDGQALDPTSFGEFDVNGVWQPKAYTGTYPGNSFHLDFADNSTAAALGTDTSGNGNDWTPINLSATPSIYATNDVITASSGVVPNGGTPYWIDIIPTNAHLGYNFNRLGFAHDSSLSTFTYWVGDEYTEGNVLRARLDLRQFPTVSSVRIYARTDDGGYTPYDARLLDSGKNIISGTNASLGGTTPSWITVPVSGNPRYLEIYTSSGAFRRLYMYAIEINGVRPVNTYDFDSLVDTPTSYGTDTGAGGEVRGNYCTLNPIDNPESLVYTNGNLDATVTPTGTYDGGRATFGLNSGKWYFELVSPNADLTNDVVWVGLAKSTATFGPSDANYYVYYNFNGHKVSATSTAYGATWVANDVIGVAFDADAGSLTFYKNGVSQGVAFTGLTSGPYFPVVQLYKTDAVSASFNFGQRPFAFSAPLGFKALCTANLP